MPAAACNDVVSPSRRASRLAHSKVNITETKAMVEMASLESLNPVDPEASLSSAILPRYTNQSTL